MKFLESISTKITIDKHSENLPHLEIALAVLIPQNIFFSFIKKLLKFK